MIYEHNFSNRISSRFKVNTFIFHSALSGIPSANLATYALYLMEISLFGMYRPLLSQDEVVTDKKLRNFRCNEIIHTLPQIKLLL